MPTESSSAVPQGGGTTLPPPAALKCAICGAASLSPVDGVVILGEEIERFCAACFRAESSRGLGLTLGIIPGNQGGAQAQGSSRQGGGGGGITSLTAAARRRSECEPVVLDLARIRDAAVAARRPRSTLHASEGATSQVAPRRPPTPTVREQSADDADSTLCQAGSPSPLPTPLAESQQSPEEPVGIPTPRAGTGSTPKCDPDMSTSLPAPPMSPWATVPSLAAITAAATAAATPSSVKPAALDEEEHPANPLLDVTRSSVKSQGRGCLYPGSIFRGTQNSGRSSYEVDIEIVNVDFNAYTLCGYLTISNLTDSHPQLTTFFDGEIIGPKYGFITGERFGATEHDDIRHWGRFEQFRRTSTRQDVVREEMLFRDPLQDTASGETRPKEREFCFIRLKEKFLVPDHSVRDISGASFAGFYYAIVDFSPAIEVNDEPPASPAIPRSPLRGTGRRMSSTGPRPDPPRRQSTSTTRTAETASGTGPAPRRPSTTAATRPEAPRRASVARAPAVPREATIKGYYFHSLNQEPFQELDLTHVPSYSRGTFELR